MRTIRNLECLRYGSAFSAKSESIPELFITGVRGLLRNFAAGKCVTMMK